MFGQRVDDTATSTPADRHHVGAGHQARQRPSAAHIPGVHAPAGTGVPVAASSSAMPSSSSAAFSSLGVRTGARAGLQACLRLARLQPEALQRGPQEAAPNGAIGLHIRELSMAMCRPADKKSTTAYRRHARRG